MPYDSATPDDLAETATMVEALDRRVLTRQGDVRDLDGMKAFLDTGVAEFGRLDIVVANAGICIPATWDETTPMVFRDTTDINVTGVWNTVMAGAPHLVSADGGSIVLTSSYAGKEITRTNESNPPLAAMGTPFLPRWAVEADDIAAAVAFLASDDARFITSEHLSIDAGAQYF